MKTVKVTFANGDSIVTSINGTDDEIKAFYGIGRAFNFGFKDDNMQSVTKLEFIG